MCATHAAACCLHRDGYQVFSNKEVESITPDGSTPTRTHFNSLDKAQTACSNAAECKCFIVDGTEYIALLLSGGSITDMFDSPGSCTWCKSR